ncbi:helix-turn-helix transcriptional regulator [Asanoa iriomotensis]|uniref:HTH cro/C1-type domain-containing protein n=1 Tax=Asanoa iriomotensis TaxID=234613 RepID=A0ABQ4C4A8_9ACTN|nr:helix-turn-helix transcriptional regulator [Asanoa iriomotensis]GIF57623.1 hypothetical protein Air01nite_37180 [Asanoa iriomotensis]
MTPVRPDVPSRPYPPAGPEQVDRQVQGRLRVGEAWLSAGRVLAAHRVAAGLTQHNLAGLVPWSRSTIANVERGRQNVPDAFWAQCDAVVHAGGRLTAAAADARSLARVHAQQVAASRSAVPQMRWCRCGGLLRVPVGVGWPG